ncbi:enoyl-CoA hydratase/isomerase [gamma proteobacterium HdN1]|nr:enoyl-CoA hydratase/isomerase [gamma proteobacterium HdN1]
METHYTTLLTERKGPVLHITLNRPESRNAMSLQMVIDLQALFTEVADRTDIRILVLRGANGHFCAGGDIKDMASARGRIPEGGNPIFDLNRHFGRMITQADQCPQLLITVLEGAVLGGGFGLACVSDVAIAHKDAQFGLPETSLGVIPAQIAPFVVQRIGLTQARRLALLGNRIHGAEAVRLGIAHTLADSTEALEAELSNVLTQAKKCAPNANRVTKALLHRVGHEPLSGLLDSAAQSFADAILGGEAQEGTMAFVQKRLPRWAQDE